MKRTHMVYILSQMLKYAFLLIVPLARRLILSHEKLSLSLLPEILYLVLFVTYTVLKWRSLRYEITEEYFLEHRGFFLKRVTEIPVSNIASVDIESGFFLKPFRAVRIAIDTVASHTRRSDVVLYLSPAQAKELSNIFMGETKDFHYSISARKVLFTAFSSANVTLGLLLLAPFVNKAGKLLGKELSERLIGTVSYAQSLFAKYIPPIFTGMAYILVVSWIVSIVYLFARTANFRLLGNKTHLHTIRGLVVPRHTYLNLQGIRALMIRQTRIMRCFRLHEALLCSAGYGSKGELTLLFPCESSEKIEEIVATTVDIPRPQISVFSRRKARAQMGVSVDFTSMITKRFFTIMSIYIKKENIESILIKQSPLQKRRGLCKVKIVPRNPKRHRYAVRGMNYNEVMEKIH